MKTLAIYAGSFNPFHIGHLNILDKAEKIFGKGNVLVAMGVNPAKLSLDEVRKGALEKMSLLENKIGRKVEAYFSFLHEFIEQKEKEGYDVVLVRGLRNGDDLAYENNQLSFIHDFKPEVKSVFIMCDKQYEHVSSSSIRQLESFIPGSGSKYLV